MVGIPLVLLFSGCYSAMHTAKVIDGPNLTLSAYPIHHDIEHRESISLYGSSYHGIKSYDIFSSVALRYGWAAQRKGEIGHSIGITFDVKKHQHPDKSIMVRYSYFVQAPKNSVLDMGIGIETRALMFPSSLYILLSKEMGNCWEIYVEGQAGSVEGIGSLGIKFDISKHFSILAETSLILSADHEYGEPWKYVVAPLVGIGFVCH
jgi:hypothetical protein